MEKKNLVFANLYCTKLAFNCLRNAYIGIKIFIFSAFIFTAITTFCQSSKADCNSVRNGTFFSYPKNSADKYVSKREDSYQYEKNLLTGDSTVYKVEWVDDCKYSLKLVTSNAKMTAAEKDFWEKHKLVYVITGVAKNYYTFNGYADKSSNLLLTADTMWLKEKINHGSNELVQPVKNETVLKRSHFADTSKWNCWICKYSTI